MVDVQLNGQSITASGTSGTTAPASGTAETWTVSALGSGIPTLTTGQAYALVDQAAPTQAEIVRVTAAVAGATSITVTRGADSTTPVVHSAGAVFAVVAVASALRTVFPAGSLIGFASYESTSQFTQAFGSPIDTTPDGGNILSVLSAATFTVPPSGRVLARIEGGLFANNSVQYLFGIATSTSPVTVPYYGRVGSPGSGSGWMAGHYARVVTGLTPGASASWRVAVGPDSSNVNTVNIYISAQNPGVFFGIYSLDPFVSYSFSV